MRKIDLTGQFKRDFKREAKGQHRATLDADLTLVLEALANDQPLEPRHRDHALAGEWKDYRDCHVKPDLVLIYRKPDEVGVTTRPAWFAQRAWPVAPSGGAHRPRLGQSRPSAEIESRPMLECKI